MDSSSPLSSWRVSDGVFAPPPALGLGGGGRPVPEYLDSPSNLFAKVFNELAIS